VHFRKIVVGLSAMIAVAGIAACSSGVSASQHLGEASASQTKAQGTTSATPATTTVAPTTAPSPTTTVAPKPTTPPPATTPPATHQQATQAAATATGIPCSSAVSACVDLSTHTAWLVRGGKVIYGPVSIMPGSRSFPTPAGTFHVLSKNAHYWSREFQAPMPDAVFFYPGDAFHVGSLRVYSHGCIHLSWTAAATFFKTLFIGDVVQVIR
jgi:lipoprotein-anchoring transpeptidase ErfK/SrfK